MRYVVLVIGVIKKRDRYLLTKRVHENKRYHGLWQLPGGGLEPEETVIDCLKREIKEETNIDVINPVLIPKIFDFFRDNWRAVTICYLNLVNGERFDIKLDREASDYGWFTKDQIKSLKTMEGTNEIIDEAEKIRM
jgi:ADP-ribose pyrophosphatase YjhB (NUDIX family)